MEKKVTSRDRILAYIAIFTFFVIGLIVTIYAIYTRPLSAFVAAIPTLVATYALFAIKLLIDKKIEVSALIPSKFNYFGFGYIFILIGAAFVTYGLFVSAFDGIHYLTKLDSVYHAAISALVVGIVLFFFRLHVRFWYGAVEVAVGVIVAMSVYQSNVGKDTSSLYLTVLTAGVYLIVRGLDNVHQGWATDKLNKWLEALFTQQAKKQKEAAEAEKRQAEETARQKKLADEAAQRLAEEIEKRQVDEANKRRQREAARVRKAAKEEARREREDERNNDRVKALGQSQQPNDAFKVVRSALNELNDMVLGKVPPPQPLQEHGKSQLPPVVPSELNSAKAAADRVVAPSQPHSAGAAAEQNRFSDDYVANGTPADDRFKLHDQAGKLSGLGWASLLPPDLRDGVVKENAARMHTGASVKLTRPTDFYGGGEDKR